PLPDALPICRTGEPKRERTQCQYARGCHQTDVHVTRSAASLRGVALPNPANTPHSPSSTGNPAGRNGAVASATTAPAAAARAAPASRSDGSSSASNTAGNAASKPNAAVSLISEPAKAPPTTPMFQHTNRQPPHSQYAARRRPASRWASANATDSSIMTWLPMTLDNQPVPNTSPRVNPNGRCRALTNSPAATAAIGLPAEATIPTNINCEAPANTTSESSIGNQMGSPDVTAIAPKDMPTM